MKKLIAFMLASLMVLTLCGCGESGAVKDLIEQIGEVSLDSESAISEAEKAYNELSENDQAKVSNYDQLAAAREAYEELLIEEAKEQAYSEGLSAMEAEEYEAAIESFTAADDYQDAADLIEQCNEELAKPKFETDYINIEGVYVDSSYTCEENENYRFLYVVYSAFTSAENLTIDCKSMQLTVNETNTYTAVRESAEVRYMSNYYNGAYLKTVTVGDTVKFVETFQIPEGELDAGRTITLEKDQIPQMEEIHFSTDDIVFCDNPEEIAQLADPDGYEAEVWALSDADAEVVQAVKAEINGYQWDVSISPLYYEMEFFAPNSFELRTSFSTATGTYEVKNAYIICTNTIGGVIEVPFTYENGVVEVDMIAALDYSM